MELDPRLLIALGDVFLNLSAGWFGTAIILPWTQPRGQQANAVYVVANLLLGITALAIGYRLRILEL